MSSHSTIRIVPLSIGATASLTPSPFPLRTPNYASMITSAVPKRPSPSQTAREPILLRCRSLSSHIRLHCSIPPSIVAIARSPSITALVHPRHPPSGASLALLWGVSHSRDSQSLPAIPRTPLQLRQRYIGAVTFAPTRARLPSAPHNTVSL